MNYFWRKCLEKLALGQFVSRCYRHPPSEYAREKRIRKLLTSGSAKTHLVKTPGFVSQRRSACATETKSVFSARVHFPVPLTGLNTVNSEKHHYLRQKIRQPFFAEHLNGIPKLIADIDL